MMAKKIHELKPVTSNQTSSNILQMSTMSTTQPASSIIEKVVVNSPLPESKINNTQNTKPKKQRSPRAKRVAPTVKTQNIDPKIEEKKSIKSFSTAQIMSFAFKGLFNIYQNKFNVFSKSALFMYKHLFTIMTFLTGLLTPALMTYGLVTYVPYITEILSTTTLPMNILYHSVFYVISSVVFLTSWIFIEGMVSNLKHGVLSLAEVGMTENN